MKLYTVYLKNEFYGVFTSWQKARYIMLAEGYKRHEFRWSRTVLNPMSAPLAFTKVFHSKEVGRKMRALMNRKNPIFAHLNLKKGK